MERAVERLSELQDKLASLQDALEQLKEHIARLANFDFQSGDLDDTATSELSTEIIQLIQEQEEDLDLLHEEIADIRPFKALKHDKDRLQDGAERLKEELHGCRPLLRKAQVRAKHNLQQAQKRERELLWASFSQSRSAKTSGTSSPRPVEKPRRKPRSEMSKDEQAVASSSDVTLALRRTHDMMAAELSRSDFARKTLQESTAALAQLGESVFVARYHVGEQSRPARYSDEKPEERHLVSTNLFLHAGPHKLLAHLPPSVVRSIVVAGLAAAEAGVPGCCDRHQSGAARRSGSAGCSPDGKPVEPSMNNEGVPTIQAGQPQETTEMIVDPGNDESMVEEIGRMIDESKQGNSEVFDNEAGVVVEEVQDIPALEPERVRVEL